MAFRLSPAAESNLIDFPRTLPSVSQDSPFKLSDIQAPEKNDTPSVDEHYARIVGARTLNDRLSLSSNFDQNVAMYYRLARAGRSDIVQLLEESKSIHQHSEREAIQGIIFGRFAAIDPLGALDYVDQMNLPQRNSLVNTIFWEWARSDLDKAVESAQALSDTRRQFANQAILRARDDLPSEARRELAENLDRARYLSSLTSQSETRELLSDSRGSWNHLIETSNSKSVPQATLIFIANVRFHNEGADALSEMINSLAHSSLREVLLPALVRNFASYEPDRVLDILQELPQENDAEKLMTTVFKRWAANNARAAFTRATDLDFANSTYKNLETVIDVWVKKDPEAVLNEVESLPSELVNWTLSNAISTLAETSPTTAISYWDDIDNLPLKRKLTTNIVDHWKKQDPNAATNWILTQPKELANDRLKATTLVALARKDAELALSISSRQQGELGVLLDSEILRSVARSNVDQAIGLLSRLESESRFTSALNVGEILVDKDLRRAFEIGNIFNEDQKSEYFNQLVSKWTRSRPNEVIKKLDELPANSLTPTSARFILEMNGKLTQEQYNYVSSRLSEEDQKTYRRRREHLGI